MLTTKEQILRIKISAALTLKEDAKKSFKAWKKLRKEISDETGLWTEDQLTGALVDLEIKDFNNRRKTNG